MINSLHVMVLFMNPSENGNPVMAMDEMTTEEREYEALVTVRDLLLLLHSEISENTGDGCNRLRSAYEYVNAIVLRMGLGQ